MFKNSNLFYDIALEPGQYILKKGLPDSKPSLAPSVIVCVVAICHATLGISRFPPPFACQLHVLRSQFFKDSRGYFKTFRWMKYGWNLFMQLEYYM